MRFMICGGTGFIGKALADAMLARGDEVWIVTRKMPAAPAAGFLYVTWEELSKNPARWNGLDGIVNLAGESINQRWNEESKRRILVSRTQTAMHLADIVKQMTVPPKVVVNASAVALYGHSFSKMTKRKTTPYIPASAASAVPDSPSAGGGAEAMAERTPRGAADRGEADSAAWKADSPAAEAPEPFSFEARDARSALASSPEPASVRTRAHAESEPTRHVYPNGLKGFTRSVPGETAGRLSNPPAAGGSVPEREHSYPVSDDFDPNGEDAVYSAGQDDWHTQEAGGFPAEAGFASGPVGSNAQTGPADSNLWAERAARPDSPLDAEPAASETTGNAAHTAAYTPATHTATGTSGQPGSRLAESFEEELFDENSPADPADYLGRVVVAWEEAADQIPVDRIVKLRLGLVLARKGGPFPLLRLPYRLLVGGRIGDGTQGFPWIHLQDAVSLILFCLDTPEIEGPVNAVAPDPVTNDVFGRTLGEVMRRPHWLPVPSGLLRAFLGERAVLVLTGQLAYPLKALEHGFQFAYPRLDEALRDLTR